MERGAAGQEIGRLGGGEQLPVDARRRSQRARDGRPDGPGRAESPVPTCAGLDLEAGVVVVLELGAKCDVQPVGHERDLVLDERGEPLSCNMRRQEGEGRAVDDAIVDVAEIVCDHLAAKLWPLTAISLALGWLIRPSYRSPWTLTPLVGDASQSTRKPPCRACQSSAASRLLGNSVG